MVELLLKSEKTTQSFKKSFHLYQDGERYFLRRDLYKSKNRKQLVLSDDFEIELINFEIQLPSPSDRMLHQYFLWIPSLNFIFSEGTLFKMTVTTLLASVWLLGKKEYEMHDKNAGEYVKNYIRKMNLKSMLD